MTFNLEREARKAEVILAARHIVAETGIPVSDHKSLAKALWHIRRAQDYFAEIGMEVDLLSEFNSHFGPQAEVKPTEDFRLEPKPDFREVDDGPSQIVTPAELDDLRKARESVKTVREPVESDDESFFDDCFED